LSDESGYWWRTTLKMWTTHEPERQSKITNEVEDIL
jgi:hypothetical protein